MKRTETQHEVAVALKADGAKTIDEIAFAIGATYETARAQVVKLDDLGLVESTLDRSSAAGRPSRRWRLTDAGEHLFPKQYRNLANNLLTILAATLPDDELDRVLEAIVNEKVAGWLPVLEGVDFEIRLAAMKSIYSVEDPYISVESDGEEIRLIERNCPYLDVAKHHPVLCNVTLNTLSRILNRQVVREQTFQAGDGRCVFLISADKPKTDSFIRH